MDKTKKMFKDVTLIADATIIAAEFGVTRKTVYIWIKKGKFTCNRTKEQKFSNVFDCHYFVLKDKKYFNFLKQHNEKKETHGAKTNEQSF